MGDGNLWHHPLFNDISHCDTGRLRGKYDGKHYLFLKVKDRDELMKIMGVGCVRGVSESRIFSRDYEGTSGLISQAISSCGRGRAPREALYRWIQSAM